AGLLANLIGITALTVYREVLRGVDRYGAVAAYNVACNLVQLVAVAGLWFFGFTEPVLYITAFGLSSLAAIAVVAPWAHVSLRPSLRDVNRERVSAAARFVAPMLLQTVFFMLWLNADVIVLKALAGLAPVGEYGVAKSLANAALLIPSAIATALLPQAARIGNKDARGGGDQACDPRRGESQGQACRPSPERARMSDRPTLETRRPEASSPPQAKVTRFFDEAAGFWTQVYSAPGVFADTHRRRLELA